MIRCSTVKCVFGSLFPGVLKGENGFVSKMFLELVNLVKIVDPSLYFGIPDLILGQDLTLPANVETALVILLEKSWKGCHILPRQSSIDMLEPSISLPSGSMQKTNAASIFCQALESVGKTKINIFPVS